MLYSVFLICYLKPISNPKVLMEGVPKFIEMQRGRPTSLFGDRKGKYELLDNSQFEDDSNTNRIYTESIIEISMCTFTKCNALGSGYYRGSGGAIFCEKSQLYIHSESAFIQNQAIIGGAISIIDGDCRIEGSSQNLQIIFQDNAAYYLGGAIFVNGQKMNYVSGEYERAHYFQIEHTSFSCNHAHEFGGSLFLFGVSDSWINHSIFENNSAIESGGAIGFYECDGMFLFSCTFISNACCDRQFFKNELLYDKTNHVFNKKIHAKGGGAIVVCNTEISRNNLEQKPDYRTTVIFATERCFFINNNCERQSSKEAFTKGFDIRFKGEITFQSYEDRFVNEQSLSIVGYNNETFHRHQTLFYNPNIDRDWDNFTNESNINFYQFTDKIEPMKNVFINYNINDYSWNPTSAFTENVPIIHDNVDDIITEDNELPDLPTNNFQTKLPERTTKSYAPDKTLIPSELKVPSYSRTIALIPGLYVDDDSDDSSNKNKISTGTIIGIAVGAAALLVIIVLIIFYALRKAYTMHSSIEMDPENATMETSTGSAMTENNPLYQKGNDDPFREDFTEEVHHELKKK